MRFFALLPLISVLLHSVESTPPTTPIDQKAQSTTPLPSTPAAESAASIESTPESTPLDSPPAARAHDSHDPIEDTLISDDAKEIYREQVLVKQKSGKYFSIGIGTSTIRTNRFLASEVISGDYSPMVFFLKGGAQSFFTRNVGIRGFFAFDTYSKPNYTFKNIPYTPFFGFVSLGIDTIAEFAITKNQRNFLGGFFGIGVGAVLYLDDITLTKSEKALFSQGFIVEAGIELTLAIKHRIALGAKLTPIKTSISKSLVARTDILPYLSYQYQF